MLLSASVDSMGAGMPGGAYAFDGGVLSPIDIEVGGEADVSYSV